MPPTARDLFDDLLERITALDKATALETQALHLQVAEIRRVAEALEVRVKAIEKPGAISRARSIYGRPELIWAAILLALATAAVRILGLDSPLLSPPEATHAPAPTEP